ncbi:MAG: 2-C-methyl-D-erythritol 4-phosphate cytidylyltransferase [Propionibacteriaceae bacterium]|nr:2-C-methyl-D-erythritol 4-phosphate cytidylyltransferase [Propionibacteriaceae bacterium]
MTSAPAKPEVAAIVVAAGSGIRLGREIPKAAIEIAGVPMVTRSVQAMFSGGVDKAVVVAPEAWVERFSHFFPAYPDRVKVISGGVMRQDSVRLGLVHMGDADIVLVHDAARPLVPPFVVDRVIEAVRDGAPVVIPVVPQVDSLRRIRRNWTVAVDRSTFLRVQTPQGFEAQVLRRAHAQAGDKEFTDDATMCEAIGMPVMTVPGDGLAFKITDPMDLVLAEVIARGES